MSKTSLKTSALALAILVAAATPSAAGMAVKFLGTAQANDLSPGIEQRLAATGVDVDGFACFQAPLFDVAGGQPIGTGVDCLNPFDVMGDGSGDGLQIEAKTFFFFRNGVVVNHGCTSARPFFAGVGDAGVTHMTGSIPPSEFGAEALPIPACAEAAGVIHTSGRYRHTSGEIRLSGAVDLSVAGEITFSCMFVLDLHPFGRNDDAPAEQRSTRRVDR